MKHLTELGFFIVLVAAYFIYDGRVNEERDHICKVIGFGAYRSENDKCVVQMGQVYMELDYAIATKEDVK